MKNMKLLSFVLLLTSLPFVCGCSSRKESSVRNTFSKELILVDSLKSFQVNRGWVSRRAEKPLKLVTYVDGTCSQCIYELENWKDFLLKENLEDVQFLVYVRTLDIRVIEELLSQVGFDYPVIIDFDDTFSIVNELSPKKIEQTFLLNGENEVILIGNPLYDVNIKRLYLNTINGES